MNTDIEFNHRSS